MKGREFFFAFCFALQSSGATLACDFIAETPTGGELRVGVSVAPQKYIVDRIGGDAVSVQVLIPAGADPHAYEPGPEQLRILSDLTVYFRQGLEFETACLRRLRGINAGMRVVDLGPDTIRPPSAAPGDPRYASDQEENRSSVADKDHLSESYAHAHGGHLNPHTWLSPRLVRVQSDVILATLTELRPEHRSRFERGHSEFRAEVDRVDAYVRRRLAPLRDRLLVVYHPSWEYFARDYGLRMLAVQESGHDPSARDLMKLVQLSRAAGVKTIFAEPGFNQRSVRVVARDIDARVEIIDPLAADWAQNMCDTADQIAEALQP
ncbi:MAG: zinc ABC transporter substrate-binding protein [Leptospirales bacterium]